MAAAGPLPAGAVGEDKVKNDLGLKLQKDKAVNLRPVALRRRVPDASALLNESGAAGAGSGRALPIAPAADKHDAV